MEKPPYRSRRQWNGCVTQPQTSGRLSTQVIRVRGTKHIGACLHLDGAFYSRENAGATGAFLHAKAEWRNHVSGAMTMEVLALKEGLILARQMGVRRICSETDCVEVVHL